MKFPNQFHDLTNSEQYAQTVGVPFDNGSESFQHGQVFLYNDSRFNQSFFSQPLTTYVVGGWNRSDLSAEIDALCGRPVPVSRKFSHKVWDNTEALATDGTDDLRAIGGDFKVVRLTSTEVERKTVNRGLAMILDRDEMTNVALDEQKAAMYLMSRIQLNIAKRAFDLAAAAGINTPRTWNTSANPDSDMRTSIRTAADLSGLRPNNVVFGDTAWDARVAAYDAQATAAAFQGASATPEQVASRLRVGRVYVSNARYSSSPTARTGIAANLVLSYFVDNSGMDLDPSNIKRFYTPTAGGGPIRVFRRELSETSVMIGVEHFELIAIPFSTGIRKETVN